MLKKDLDAARARFLFLQEQRPLSGHKAHLRYCGIVSSFARGAVGNTSWAWTMKGKYGAKFRWKPERVKNNLPADKKQMFKSIMKHEFLLREGKSKLKAIRSLLRNK